MNDTPAQGTTPRWSDTQVTKAAHHNSQHVSYYSSTLHALRQMRDDYETDRQRLIAELAESQAYVLRLERALGEAWQPVPDGEYSGGNLKVHVLAGRYVMATKAQHDDNGREYWNGASLPDEYRLCRRTSSSPTVAPQDAPPA